MTEYRIEWSETWLRTVTADIDEDAMRDHLKVPIGPISFFDLREYLEEDYGDGLEWHPQTTPGIDYKDEFLDLDIDSLDPPEGRS